MDHTVALTIYAHLLIFATTVANLVYAWMKEGRRHKWQEEMRKAVDAVATEVKNGNGRHP